MPENTAATAREWAEKEGAKAKVMETMNAFNCDPSGTLEAMK